MDMESHPKTDIELQLNSAIQQYQFFTGQLVQSVGFLIAANAVLLGYGINGHTSGAILLAALMPLLMLLMRIGFSTRAVVAAYVAIQLEQQLNINADPLMSMQIASAFPQIYRRLLEIVNMQSQEARIEAMRKYIRRRYYLKGAGNGVYLSASLVQIGLFLFATIGLSRPFI